MARGEIHLQLAVGYGEDADVRKLSRYGKDARACRDLFVQMLCYCKRTLSDGYVPADEVGVLVYPDPPKVGVRDADRLVEVGLAQKVDGGYFFPSFLKRNKSRAEVDAESSAKADAGRKGGERSGKVRRAKAEANNSLPDREADAKQSASLNEAGCFGLVEHIGHRSETEVIDTSVGSALVLHRGGRDAPIKPSTTDQRFAQGMALARKYAEEDGA